MANNEHVPETKDVKPNREQRRHPEQAEQPQDQPLARDDQFVEQDVPDPRTDHQKKTADKWNQ
jgi:hypothetical protein